MVASWRGGPRAAANPWRALTLEWQVSSPPPIFNFDTIPTVVGGPYEYGVPGAVHGVFKGGRRCRNPGARDSTPQPTEPGGVQRMKTILVVANETLGGAPCSSGSANAPAEGDDVRVVICVPRTQPRQGNVIYDEAVYDAAQVRIDLARAVPARATGIDAVGDVGDPDPYTATMDAVAEYAPGRDHHLDVPRDLLGLAAPRPDRARRDATGVPVEHVVTDIDNEGLPFKVTLVVANRTASSDAAARGARQQGARASASTCSSSSCPRRAASGRARSARAGASTQVRRAPARATGCSPPA